MEETTIEKLQKENADLKRQLENQRTDLLLLTKTAINSIKIAWSSLNLIENYLQEGVDGEVARQDIHGMLAFQEKSGQLTNNSADNGAVSFE